MSNYIDGGWYLFTVDEQVEFCRKEPKARAYFRPWIGSEEFIHGVKRWFLWLKNIKPDSIRAMPMVRERIEAVQRFRRGEEKGKNGRNATDAATAKLAQTPTRLHVENVPTARYLVIPKVSSESRDYIPIAFVEPETLSSDLLFLLPTASIYHFGVLTSRMHMAWMRATAGRHQSRYRYSAGIVYNNYPWPDPTPQQRKRIEAAAQSVLTARSNYPVSTFATLYDPAMMPYDIARAHASLDRAVDAAYGPPPRGGWTTDAFRVAFLFRRYARLTAPIIQPAIRRLRATRPR